MQVLIISRRRRRSCGRQRFNSHVDLMCRRRMMSLISSGRWCVYPQPSSGHVIPCGRLATTNCTYARRHPSELELLRLSFYVLARIILVALFHPTIVSNTILQHTAVHLGVRAGEALGLSRAPHGSSNRRRKPGPLLACVLPAPR